MLHAPSGCSHAALLMLLACMLYIAQVQSCSDVAMTDTAVYDAIISARNYDFFAQKVLPMQFSMMPAKTSVAYTPLVGCRSPQGLPTSVTRSKYAYICATVARFEFATAFSLVCPRFDSKNFRKYNLDQTEGGGHQVAAKLSANCFTPVSNLSYQKQFHAFA